MSTKITASGLCNICADHLHGCPEDDTIFLSLDGHSKLLFSGQDFRSGAPTPGRFYLYDFVEVNKMMRHLKIIAYFTKLRIPFIQYQSAVCFDDPYHPAELSLRDFRVVVA